MADYSYRLDHELIIISVKLLGKLGAHSGKFVLDTGASAIIIDHDIAYALGYSSRDGVGFSTVSSAVGKEKGYRLVVEAFEALGK
jgi:predicted aspartyl protease